MCVKPALLYAAETWKELLACCDHRMLRYMSGVRLQDRITKEKVGKRCGVENLEHRLMKTRLRYGLVL